jgi:hypothetical protein
MMPDKQAERWKKLQRLRWSIILLFFVLFMFNSYPSAEEIHFMSGTAVIVSYVGHLFQVLLVPTFIVIGIKERRARLAAHASKVSLAEESDNN